MSFKSQKGRKIWGFIFLAIGLLNLVSSIAVLVQGERLMMPILSVITGSGFIVMGYALIKGKLGKPAE